MDMLIDVKDVIKKYGSKLKMEKNKNKVSSKIVINFLELVTQLEPIEFVGLSKILCVPLVNQKNEPREFEDILSDMIDKFISTGRKQRKDIIKVLKQSIKETK